MEKVCPKIGIEKDEISAMANVMRYDKVNYIYIYIGFARIQWHSAGWFLLIVLALRKSLTCWPVGVAGW